MSEITPPPPPPPTPPTTPPAPPPTLTVTSPPPGLADLPVGARLDAVIAQTTPQGQIALESALGRLLVQTAFPLPDTGSLQLQLLAQGAQPQLLITAIHGLAPQAALRALGLAFPGAATPGTGSATTPGVAGAAPGVTPAAFGGAPQPGLAAAGAPAAVDLTVGATLPATLLRLGPAVPAGAPGAGGVSAGGGAAAGAGAGQAVLPGAPPAAPGATGATATPGTGQAAQATGAPANPGTAAATSPSGTGQATPSPAAGTVPPAGTPAPAPGLQQPPVPGTLFNVRVTAIQPPAPNAAPGVLPPVPAGGELAPGGILSGVVTVSASPSGQPIVQTHAGVLVVAARTPLLPGTLVTFEVLNQAPPPEGTPHVPLPAAQAEAALFRQWPALEEAIRALEEVNPALAQQVLHAVLPRPGVTLAANVLFFLVALTGGDFRAWIGDGPARLLQRTNPGLLRRLGDEFGRIGRIAEEPASGSDWRAVPIPIVNGAEIEQIRLFIRQAGDDTDDDEDEESRKGVRFVVDMDLSRLGRFQLDGLVYEKNKHMDLIVRTENKLPGRIENDIRQIFENTNGVTGIEGGITFQAAPPNFIEVGGAPETEPGVGLIV